MVVVCSETDIELCYSCYVFLVISKMNVNFTAEKSVLYNNWNAVTLPVNIVSVIMLGAVQVGYIDHDVVINPSRKELQCSQLNLIVSATEQKKVGEFA